MTEETKDKKGVSGETIAMPATGPEAVKKDGETRSLLLIDKGPRQGTKFQLKAERNVIGRGADVEVKLDDSSVSRQHATISSHQGGWAIEDQGSRNGTLVNGQKIEQKVIVTPKDIIQVGAYTLKLIVQKTSDAKPVADWEGKTMMKPRG